jgi:hypothetical protein
MDLPLPTREDIVARYPTVEERFRAGVESLFVIWDALDAMRDNMTGGVETEEKIEDMLEGVLEQFDVGVKPRARVTQTDLEDMFFDFTETELRTMLEDGSVEQIADYVFKLYRELIKDELAVLQKVLFASDKKRRLKPRTKVTVVVEEEKLDDQQHADDHDTFFICSLNPTTPCPPFSLSVQRNATSCVPCSWLLIVAQPRQIGACHVSLYRPLQWLADPQQRKEDR